MISRRTHSCVEKVTWVVLAAGIPVRWPHIGCSRPKVVVTETAGGRAEPAAVLPNLVLVRVVMASRLARPDMASIAANRDNLNPVLVVVWEMRHPHVLM